ncbi:MAG: DUF1080 domain-containing protein [Lacipirellulaceae bacterium]
MPKTLLSLCIATLLLSLSMNAQADHHEAKSGKKPEKETGFTPLLGDDAEKLWVGYNKKTWPEHWKLADGVLHRAGGGGDIVTVEKFENFDFRFEWKISEGGNSGVLYHVGLGDNQPYFTGMEYQILDHTKHSDGKSDLTSAAALYAMYPANKKVVKPVGEWNTSRIVVAGNRIEHWLNGKKIVDAVRDGDEWNRRLKASKFATWEKFAKNREGHIALQDHGDLVWYRNMRIKKLPAEEMKKAG